MVTDESLIRVVRSLLLMIGGLQETISAVALALERQGLLPKATFDAALAEVQAHTQGRKEQIEKLGTVDLAEFLRKFEGTIQ